MMRFLAAVKMPKNQSSVKIELQTFCILNSIEMESPTLKKKFFPSLMEIHLTNLIKHSLET
jgi:hypothetical protein